MNRFPLAVLPTPLVRAERLEKALGHAYPILLKRDDLTGFGVAGNKARALEFLIGDAIARGCKAIVTGGGAGSNFIVGAALAARAAGLACVLAVHGTAGPNLELARAAGARIEPVAGDRSQIDAAVTDLAARLDRAYAVPRGGSTPVGALGYARAVEELRAQLTEQPALVVIGVGSGGSIAGLIRGGAPWPLLGASVSRPVAEIEAKVLDLAGRPPAAPVRFVDARGPGFGTASPRDRDAAWLAMATEGLLLDATYTAKAFAVLVEHRPAGPVVFWHTGGLVKAITEIAKGGGHEPPIT